MAAPTTSQETAVRAQCVQVLIIDDDANTRDLAVRNLSREGINAVAAGTDEEGLRRARELQPQIILLDVLMPGMDGWAVLGALKAGPQLSLYL